jgi:6-phosphogluconolactonase/glucosamine-6-phosphate isomerase/deaminase
MSSRFSELHVSADPASAAAAWLLEAIDAALARRSVARLALSGGSTAPALFRGLGAGRSALEHVEVWQVDVRVAPDGDPARNVEQLRSLSWSVEAMPVTDEDLEVAAIRYASALPAVFDVVHLGVGDDGHTASWPPGDDRFSSDATGGGAADAVRDVAIVRGFRGHDRMTITPLVVDRARARLVLATGARKAPIIRRWMDADLSLPASRIPPAGTAIFLDEAAASELPDQALGRSH